MPPNAHALARRVRNCRPLQIAPHAPAAAAGRPPQRPGAARAAWRAAHPCQQRTAHLCSCTAPPLHQTAPRPRSPRAHAHLAKSASPHTHPLQRARARTSPFPAPRARRSRTSPQRRPYPPAAAVALTRFDSIRKGCSRGRFRLAFCLRRGT
ncbi:MAG: hypothetical protein J3K34DRAFT_410563 [Monoraphidium minutum]|nr:MAG: hypothetical protein J3K34DRAFT_410563 [Monoraphidium minutum]